jgi:UDP-N-acetylglucosamine 3-dehydrogenase
MPPGEQRPIRVGIVGFGGAGMAHARYYSYVPRCQVVRIFDPKPAGLARAAELANDVERTDSFDHFLEGLDAISVCSPDDTHASYICAALERGIHVLSEKPLTSSIEGVQRILRAARSSDAILGVLHQMRFVPLFEKQKRVVDQGRLGRIAYLEGYYVHDLTERAFLYDDWRETSAATPIVYAGCHFVDLLRWLTREEPHEVFAMSGHVAFPRYPEADLTSALYRFPSGAVGNVVVSIGTAGPQDHSVRVYGDRASIDNSAVFNRDGEWEETLHHPRLLQKETLPRQWLRHPREALRQLKSAGPGWMLANLFDLARRHGPGANSQYGARHFPVRLYEHATACVRAVENFVGAIDGREQILCGPEEAAKTVLACLAAVESYRTNTPQRVADLDEVV